MLLELVLGTEGGVAGKAFVLMRFTMFVKIVDGGKPGGTSRADVRMLCFSVRVGASGCLAISVAYRAVAWVRRDVGFARCCRRQDYSANWALVNLEQMLLEVGLVFEPLAAVRTANDVCSADVVGKALERLKVHGAIGASMGGFCHRICSSVQ